MTNARKLILLLLFSPLLVAAQDFNYNANFVYPRVDQGVAIPGNTTVNQWKLSWTVQGTLGSCSVQVDTSADGVTWTTGGLFGSVPCTTTNSGPVTVKGSAVAITGPYQVRINVTALSGTGSNSSNAGLNVSLAGWSGAN